MKLIGMLDSPYVGRVFMSRYLSVDVQAGSPGCGLDGC